MLIYLMRPPDVMVRLKKDLKTNSDAKSVPRYLPSIELVWVCFCLSVYVFVCACSCVCLFDFECFVVCFYLCSCMSFTVRV